MTGPDVIGLILVVIALLLLGPIILALAGIAVMAFLPCLLCVPLWVWVLLPVILLILGLLLIIFL